MSNIPTPDDQEARTQRHLAILDNLIAHGQDLANRVHRQATQPTPDEPGSALAEPGSALAEPGSALAEPNQPEPEPTISPETIALFDQISRAVRRAILVSRKLAEPLPLAPPKPNPDRLAADRTATRKRIIREVEDTIHREAGANADTLQAELHERVESVDLDDDIGRRSAHEIIAEICRDLHAASNWDKDRFKRRTPQDLKALNARAAGPNFPAKPDEAPPRPTACQPERPNKPKPANPAPNGFSKPDTRPPKL